MRLEIDDKIKVYNELIAQLEKNDYKVSYDKRYGTIRRAGKGNIWCYPALNDSAREGKQGYTFLTIELGGYDREGKNKDLGYWLKEYGLNSKCLSKYGNQNKLPSLGYGVVQSATSSIRPVQIDTNNMKGIISDFIGLLNDDYNEVLKRKKKLNSSLEEDLEQEMPQEEQRVSIHDTGTIFDGKEGIISEDIGESCLVRVAFGNNTYVAQIFNKNNLTTI